MAGSYADTGQQESLLTSAWYRLPANDAGHPLVVVTAAGTIAGNSILNNHTDGQTVELEIRPTRTRWHAGRRGAGGTVRSGAGAVLAQSALPAVGHSDRCDRFRIVAQDKVAVARGLGRRHAAAGSGVAHGPGYIGSTAPVLMDWAVGLAFPCQQPMLHSTV